MVNCLFCGKELTSSTAKFCASCGSKVTDSNKNHVPANLSFSKLTYPRPKPSYRPWLIVLSGLATIVIFFIAFVLVSAFFLSTFFEPSLGSGIEIHSDDDFPTYSSSGIGTKEDPYILSNYNLSGELFGFSIHDTTKHFVITQCTIEICYEGINIENVAPGTATIFNNNITYDDCWVFETGPHAGVTIDSSPEINITNNIISRAGYEGLVVENSENCFIANNTLSGFNHGITLDYSDSSTIRDNYLSQNYESIHCFQSDFLNISNNTCINSEQAAITIVGSSFAIISNNTCSSNNNNWPSWDTSGINLDSCYNCTLINNSITKCYQGIYVLGSTYCKIFNNSFRNNHLYGVSIASAYEVAEFNSIYHNSFIENNPAGFSQASDNGTSNFWYNLALTQGNYWSDWNQTGVYPVAGTANTSDLYPLLEPPV